MDKKVIFCLLFVSIDEKSFFGTYALDISSLTSSIKYISEKYKNLWLCVSFLFVVFFFFYKSV